ncbi:hypothetical protein D3C78_1898030 [compost metagenome]
MVKRKHFLLVQVQQHVLNGPLALVGLHGLSEDEVRLDQAGQLTECTLHHQVFAL